MGHFWVRRDVSVMALYCVLRYWLKSRERKGLVLYVSSLSLWNHQTWLHWLKDSCIELFEELSSRQISTVERCSRRVLENPLAPFHRQGIVICIQKAVRKDWLLFLPSCPIHSTMYESPAWGRLDVISKYISPLKIPRFLLTQLQMALPFKVPIIHVPLCAPTLLSSCRI